MGFNSGFKGLITQLFFRGENNKHQDAFLWNVTPCTLLDVCKCFEETVCLRLDAVYTKYGGSIFSKHSWVCQNTLYHFT